MLSPNVVVGCVDAARPTAVEDVVFAGFVQMPSPDEIVCCVDDAPSLKPPRSGGGASGITKDL
jgi:hypothetical protein